MENQDIRWKQRFLNYFKIFESSVENYTNPSDIEKAGIIRQFGFIHQFALDTMKDFLSYEDCDNIIGSKNITKLALKNNLINDENWLKMIKTRKSYLLIYEESVLDTEYQKIKKYYYPLIQEFYIKIMSIDLT